MYICVGQVVPHDPHPRRRRGAITITTIIITIVTIIIIITIIITIIMTLWTYQ